MQTRNNDKKNSQKCGFRKFTDVNKSLLSYNSHHIGPKFTFYVTLPGRIQKF